MMVKYEQFADFPEWRDAPKGSKDDVAASLEREGVDAFIEDMPVWNQRYRSSENAERLLNYLRRRNLPGTLHNLTLAFGNIRKLLDEVEPQQPAVVVHEAVSHEDATPEPQEDEGITLGRIINDPTRSDQERKEASKKLKTLAVRERMGNSTLPKNYGQQVVI